MGNNTKIDLSEIGRMIEVDWSGSEQEQLDGFVKPWKKFYVSINVANFLTSWETNIFSKRIQIMELVSMLFPIFRQEMTILYLIGVRVRITGL